MNHNKNSRCPRRQQPPPEQESQFGSYHDCSAQQEQLEQQRRHGRLRVGGFMAGGTVIGCLALTAPFVVGMIQSPLPYMATPGSKIRNALDFVLKRQRQLPRRELQQEHSHARRFSPQPTEKPTTRDRFVFIDLGSGDGEGVYQAVSTNRYNMAIGIEFNSTLYLLSQIRRYFFWSRAQRQSSQFYYGDFFTILPRIAKDQKDFAAPGWKSTYTDNDSHKNDDENDHQIHTKLSKINTHTTILIFGVTPLMDQISRMIAQQYGRGVGSADNKDDNEEEHKTHVLAYRFRLPGHVKQKVGNENGFENTVDNQNKDGTMSSRGHAQNQLRDQHATSQEDERQKENETRTQADSDKKSNQHDEEDFPLVQADLVYDVDEMRVYEIK